LLLCRMGEQTGDELIGQFAEGQMDLRLQDREGSGIARQLLSPLCMLGSQVSVNEPKGLVRRGDGGSGLRVKAEAHAKSFRGEPYLLKYDTQ
jgi:hypothetical protein